MLSVITVASPKCGQQGLVSPSIINEAVAGITVHACRRHMQRQQQKVSGVILSNIAVLQACSII
jgi:hypothetical protein